MDLCPKCNAVAVRAERHTVEERGHECVAYYHDHGNSTMTCCHTEVPDAVEHPAS